MQQIVKATCHRAAHSASYSLLRSRQVSELDTEPVTHRELAHTSEVREKGQSSETQDTTRTFLSHLVTYFNVIHSKSDQGFLFAKQVNMGCGSFKRA